MDWALVSWLGFAVIMLLNTGDLAWAIVVSIVAVGIYILDRLDKLGKR